MMSRKNLAKNYILLILYLILVASCSTVPKKSTKTNVSFRKELEYRVNDDQYLYLKGGPLPIIDKESLDVYTSDQIDQIKGPNEDMIAKAIQECYDDDVDEGLDILFNLTHQLKKIPSYWTAIGNCYYKDRKYHLARHYYQLALNTYSAKEIYPPAYNNLGVLAEKQGHNYLAENIYKKILEVSPRSVIPKINLLNLYINYQLPHLALSIHSSIPNSMTQNNLFQLKKGFAYFQQAKYQMAMPIFKMLWNTDKRAGLYYTVSLYALGQKEEAKKIFNNVSKPDDKKLIKVYRYLQDWIQSK